MELVGRQAELEQLADWAGEAIAGSPRVVMVVGEAGIGKSRLLAELSTTLAERMLVLHGRCYEDLGIPYLPLSTAFAPLVEDWDELAGSSGRNGDDDRVDDRLSLYVRVTDRLRRAVATRPVALLVDDLHWADTASVDLLAHLVGTASVEPGAFPLLVVLGHRPVVADDRLARTIERVRREELAREIRLGGLGEAELRELVRVRVGTPPSRSLLRELAVASGGNPLSAQWLVQRLEDFGGLKVSRGVLVNEAGAELTGLPAGLDDLLRERIRTVSQGCQRMLTIAALLGDDEPIDDLAAVTGLEDSALTKFVDEATAAGLLEEHGVRYRFTHPQVRQLLYHGPAGRRRRQLHRQIADRLEGAHEGDAAYALPIAFHLRMAASEGDPTRLTRYGVAAAAHAASLGAWHDAWQLYEAVLDATSVEGDDPSAFRALLHHRAALAAWWSHDNPSAIAHATDAIRHARALGDLERWGLAAVAGMRAARAGAPTGHAVDTSAIDEFLDAAGSSCVDVQARAHADLVHVHLAVRNFDRAAHHAEQAWALAEQAGDARLSADLAFDVGGLHFDLLELDAARHWYERAVAHPREGDDRLPAVWASTRLGFVLLLGGDLDGSQVRFDWSVDVAASLGAFAEHAFALACLTWHAAVRRDHDTAERHGARAELLARLSDFEPVIAVVYPALAASRSARGDRDGALAAIDAYQSAGMRGGQRLRALVDVVTGASTPSTPHRPPRAIERVTLWQLGGVAGDLELALAGNDDTGALAAAEALQDVADRGVVVAPGWPHDIPGLLARASEVVEIPTHRTGGGR